MNTYKIVAKANGNFGAQRVGSNEVHGDFDTFGEACEAIGLSQAAEENAKSDASQY